MSAPPGWHPQPDGRERWWDGQQWTDHFRDPVSAPAPAYGQPGYDPHGAPPQKSGMSGGAKGCLIAVVVLVVLLLVGIIGAVWFVGRSVEQAVDDAQSAIPVPTGDVTVVVVQVGEGFDAGPADVGDGWTVEDGTFGRQVSGMEATFDDESRTTPTVFTMRFAGTDGGDVDTVCTANPTGDGSPADVTCIPLLGEVDETGQVQIIPTL